MAKKRKKTRAKRSAPKVPRQPKVPRKKGVAAKATRGTPRGRVARARLGSGAKSKAPAYDALDAFIDAAAPALRLPLEKEWRAAVKANLDVTLRQAALVTEFALADDVEPAPIFDA